MSDDKECKSCALLRRYEKTARERGYAMGKAAGNNELAQAQELLAAERKAHAETNTALTAEITRLEAQLAAAAPAAEPVAWMTEDGRVCNVKTKADAMHASTAESYSIPLYATPVAAAAPGAVPQTDLQREIARDAEAFEATLTERPARESSLAYPWGWRYVSNEVQGQFRDWCCRHPK